jgi:hypothetical protein
VVFSGGNGHFGFPGMHPDVSSAGSMYMHRNGRMLEATQYASCFIVGFIRAGMYQMFVVLLVYLQGPHI